MEKNLDNVMEKVMNIKQELDKVEFRVLNTKTHLETVENSMEKIGKEIMEGFHIVSTKVNHLEEELKKIEVMLEEKSRKLKK
jgi:DNA anti-recombination protein RmuC